jgi:hypothetical protein
LHTEGCRTVVLWDGENLLAEALEKVQLSHVSMICVTHTFVEHTPTAPGEVAGGWSGPEGAYPTAGRFVMPNWQFTDEISPEDFASEAEGWVALEARFVGGRLRRVCA